jgi:hypothetical protein
LGRDCAFKKTYPAVIKVGFAYISVVITIQKNP